MTEREAKLPAWARELIADLRKDVQLRVEVITRDNKQLVERVRLLSSRNEALTELLECAAKGGHITATVIADMLKTYDLQLVSK